MGVSDKIVQHANIVLQDSTEMIAQIPQATNKVDFITEHYNFEDTDLDIANLSAFKVGVTDYISGYIVRQIKSKLDCMQCILALQDDPYPSLISSSDVGEKMTYPSEFVKKVVRVCEFVLLEELKKNWLGKKYYFDFVNIKVCNCFVSFYGEMIKRLDNHGFDLLKRLISCYISIRFKSHAREQNELLKRKRLRSKMSKIVLFNHQ